MVVIRWGILSAGRISNDFCAAFHTHPPGEHAIVAVAATDQARAKVLADLFNIPKFYGCYDDLINDKDVDIIYIGTIHQYHRETCIKSLNAGKHILCEKPMCMNAKEAIEMIDLAKKKHLFFMEGFWSRFFPVYEKLRQELKSSTIGDPQVLTVSLGSESYFAESNRDLFSAGVLLSVGCYCVMLANMVFREEPKKIVASGGLATPKNVDLWDSVTLHYDQNRCAVITLHGGVTLNQEAIIYGTKGHLRMPMFWSPTSLETPSGRFEEYLPEVPFKMNYRNTAGFMYEQNHVRECLRKGLTESPIMPHSDSLQIMKILDEIRRQVGVVFDVDI